MLFRNKKREVWDELIVLVVFVAFCAAGLIYVGFLAWRGNGQPSPQRLVASSAQTPDEYRQASREIVRPFFDQVSQLTPEGIEAGGADLANLASKTQERLLRMQHIPASEREAHLSLVLLLDKWNRAGQGSIADQTDVLAKTQELLTTYPWIMQ